MNEKVFLLDAYALIFRSYYAFINRPITNSKGVNTSAIFGFVKTLQELIKKETPSHLAVAFDPAGPTFRSEIFPQYKANRPSTPEDIKASVPYIKKILEAYRIPVVLVPNFEADDIIGTLAKRFGSMGVNTYMYTPDKDYIQLVNNNIYLYKPKKSGNDAEILGVPEVREQYGLSEPIQFVDVLALWGDASDNIPGAHGIGEKTATKLIAEYGSAEGVIEHANELKGKTKEIIQNHIGEITLSKKLATIDTEVPINLSLDDILLKQPNREELVRIFEDLEFRSMLKEVSGEREPIRKDVVSQGSLFDIGGEAVAESSYKTIKDFKKSYNLVVTTEQFNRFLEDIKLQKTFCFDTETTGLDIFSAELVGIAFSWQPDSGFFLYLPKENEERRDWLTRLALVFESDSYTKVGQNLKFDIMVMRQSGIEVRGPIFDTMLAHYLIDPESRHGMDLLSERYLNYRPISIEELIGGKGSLQINMAQVSPERVAEYSTEDADVTWQLYLYFKKEIEQRGLSKLLYEIELPLVYVLADMETTGVRVDIASLDEFGKDLNSQLISLDSEIKALAGVPDLNVSSPKQLGYVLFDKLKLGAGSGSAKSSKSKQYSTSEEVLQRMVGEHPIIAKILDFRSLKKLLSSYIESIPKLVNAHTGLIHSNFNQAVTSTGRLSSNNPNLQNIPVRGERGREIRKAFIAENEQSTIMSADYSQIELRLMAHLSGDSGLIEAFREGADIHAATAAKIYGVPVEAVTREMRSHAKTANFGIIYGISSFGLSQRLNIPRGDAKALIDGYFASYPKVKEYMENVVVTARNIGYVETIFGRRRYLPDIRSNNQVVRGVAERNAINAPIQGSAADIIKIAMIKIHDEFDRLKLRSKMIMQVHDELVFNVYADERDRVREIVITNMERAADLSIPLIVDVGEGKNWLDAH